VPTANLCADGKISGPSAQKPSSIGDGADRRHRSAVGRQLSTPRVTVGAKRTVGTGRWRPKVPVSAAPTVGTRTDSRAQPLDCHDVVYTVPTVAHGATAAVGTGTDCWVSLLLCRRWPTAQPRPSAQPIMHISNFHIFLLKDNYYPYNC
jgi:hypothetical protein